MCHSICDAIPAQSATAGSSRIASRRVFLALAGSMVASRPLRSGNAHPDAGTMEPPRPLAAPQHSAFAQALTRARTQAEWAHFKASFITPEGRVVDHGNGGISHSEGQALALLFAAHFDEPDTFARILRWTRATLSRPDDHLLAWCHRPGEPARPGDRNNATDGDLVAAWALAEAADRWGQPLHRDLARAMARDVLAKMVVATDHGPVLLPGIAGFRQPDSITVNLSYYVYPAFQALSRLLPSREWAPLAEGGLQLTRLARFGRWGLVPDWISVPRGPGRIGIAADHPARFSYDAVRVPLYLAWGGHGGEPAVSAAAQFWHDPSLRRMPAWADLRTNETSPYAADPGIAAVAQVSAMASQPGFVPRQVSAAVLTPTYYAAALRLMSALAVRAIPTSAGPAASNAVMASR
jgi:endoglucanase